MKASLRVIAVLIAVAVFYTAWFFVWFWSTRRLGLLAHSGLLGTFTLFGWAITLALGPYAAIQLWRLRRGGWIAAIMIVGWSLAYYVAGVLWLRAPGAPLAPITYMLVTSIAAFGTLISRPAQRLCGIAAQPN